MGRLRHTYQGSGTKFYQQESSDNLSVDYGPACRTEVGELLEAGQAADEAAGAPGATEEAADGEEPTLRLDLILDPGDDLSVTSSAGHLQSLSAQLLVRPGSLPSHLQQAVSRPGAGGMKGWLDHFMVGGRRDLDTILQLLCHPPADWPPR